MNSSQKHEQPAERERELTPIHDLIIRSHPHVEQYIRTIEAEKLGLEAETESLRERLRECERDRERLEWIAKNRSVSTTKLTWPTVEPSALRQAIDTAMQAEQSANNDGNGLGYEKTAQEESK